MSNRRAHSYISKTLKSASIKHSIRSHIYIIADFSFGFFSTTLCVYQVGVVLDDWVFAYRDRFLLVTSGYYSVPEWWTLTKSHVANHCTVRRNPVGVQELGVLAVWCLYAAKRGNYAVVMSHLALLGKTCVEQRLAETTHERTNLARCKVFQFEVENTLQHIYLIFNYNAMSYYQS